MRIITGMISHETNTFSVVPTDLEAFKAWCYYKGHEILDAFDNTNTPLGGFIAAAKQFGDVELVPVVAANAVPGGLVTRDAFETLKQDLIQGLRNAGQFDAIVFQLHGAMVTEEYEDGDGEILKAIRKEIGDEIPIVTTLDLHGNVSQLMLDHATAFVGYDTNPHIDRCERGIEAFQCLLRILKGESKPVMARSQPPLMSHYICVRTDTGPMVSLFEAAQQWESRPGVIDVSVFGGWALADIYDAGLSFVAVTEGDRILAQEIVESLSKRALEKKLEFVPQTLVDAEEAVEKALAAPEAPVILAEIGDSPAAGSPGDGTYTLRHLIEARAKSATILMRDAEAVAKAVEAGIDSHLEMYVGGKTDNLHGSPVLVKGVVKALTDGRYINRGPMRNGVKESVGRTAVIDLGNEFELVLIEKRVSPSDLQIFRQAGVEPSEKKIVVLKSGGHFRAAYAPVAKMIIDVNTPGVTAANISQFEYVRIRRPIFPLDDI